MPLWLDLLMTPMAAPEGRTLRRMRYVWQALCVACALCVGFFGQLHRAFGRPAASVAAVLLLSCALYTWLYLARKHQHDTAFLVTMKDRP